MGPPDQAEAVAFLTALAGRGPIETPISLVFRGADTVWKLKKSVRRAFLDFTPLAARAHFARRELALNAAHAPGLYRDVAALVRRADGALALDQPGTPVDWVLRMAPVPAGDFLDAVAARGALAPALLDAVGDAVWDYHAALPALADARPDLDRVIAGNVAAAAEAGLDVAGWAEQARAALARLGDWPARRARAGFVRRAHGDLHLGNLCLWRGRPVAFDALEFDEALATIDLGHDLAFLVMDLAHRVGPAAANRVLNRYLARGGDWDLVAGLPVFLSLRAMVRAHVVAARGDRAEAGGYLTAAEAALRPRPAIVVAIGGLPGTGKSTLARALAPMLGPAPGAVVVRSDELRKRLAGVAPEARLDPAAYTRQAGAAVMAALADAVARVARAGCPVIADAAFLDQRQRQAVAAAGAPFLGVWLHAPMAVLEARVSARRGDASDAGVDVLRRMASARPGAGGWTAVDATDAAACLACVSALVRRAGFSC